MTKAEIKDKLEIMREYAKGQARRCAHNADALNTYEYGQHCAYQDMVTRIEAIIERIDDRRRY